MKGIQILNAAVGAVFSAWVYEALHGPRVLGDADSAARVATRLLEKTGIRVDYSSLGSVRHSAAHLSYDDLYELQMLRVIAVWL